MESLIRKPQTGNNKILLGAMVAAALVVAAVVAFFALQPTKQQIEQTSMEGAVREGTPEFEVLTKKIAISTDENNTMESPTGLGTIVMSIAGKIRNMTGKTLTGLEIKVTVIDQMNQPVKDKVLVVVPNQKEKLEPNETMPVRVMMEGFSKDDDRAMIRWKVTAIKAQD
jgi:hypothetical protein